VGFATAGFPTVKYLRISSRGFRRKSANRRQIIHALERAVRLQHLQDRDKWFASSNARAQRVIEFGLAEEGRLLPNLRSIADDDDLHVGRV